MKIGKLRMIQKTTFFLFVFCLIGLYNAQTVKAESNDSNETEIIEDMFIDLNSILADLTDQAFHDGDAIIINDMYLVEIDVMQDINVDTNSRISSRAINKDLTGKLVVNIKSLGIETKVATIEHTFNYTIFDDGKVHINSGKVTATTYSPFWYADAYGYTIVNTDGSMSWTTAMVELYDALDHMYYYYGTSANIDKDGKNISITFDRM